MAQRHGGEAADLFRDQKRANESWFQHPCHNQNMGIYSELPVGCTLEKIGRILGRMDTFAQIISIEYEA